MKKPAMLLIVMAVAISVFGQYNPKDQVPMDSNVRYGRLPNGLTYYVRHNEKPKDCCSFRIAQDVGAILEEDDQNGLAHFLEHLCFNGTVHFPGKSIINYFESVGVSFGEGINAYTDLDETVYRLSDVPTTREGILDSALLVLYDWSCGVLLQDEEIENERGVIIEEWRTGNTASMRMSDKRQQLTMPGSQYAKRNVIGDTMVIKNFKPQTLRDFYHKWYGPDLQAIIVVGDIDVDKMEQKIIKLFSSVKPREGMAPRTRYGALDNETPITGVYLDHEAQSQRIIIGFKHPSPSREYNGTYEAMQERDKRAMIMSCLQTRLKEKYGMDPWFNVFPLMTCSYGNLNGETDRFAIVAVKIDNGKERSTYRDLCMELERIRRYGILEEELELAKKTELASLKRYQKTYKNLENESYAYNCVNHFMTNRSLTTPEFGMKFYENYTSKLTAKELNEMVAGFFNPDDKNMFIVATGAAAPDENGVGCKECDMPTEKELLDIYLETRNMQEIEPPVFAMKECKLVEKEPKPGKIVSMKHNEEIDATEIMLSNGVKMIIKYSDYGVEQVSVEAESWGGSVLYPVKDILNAEYAGSIVRKTGVGSLTPMEQNKLLADKHAGISGAFISGYSEYISGYSNTSDFETLLQLMYLTFTAPRMDDKLFNEYIKQKRDDLVSAESSPTHDFYKGLGELEYGHCERYFRLDTNNLKQINQKRAIQIFKERYANPADFTFYIVGDLDINDSTVKANIEKWIGGMKTSKKFEKRIDDGVDIVRGTHYYYKKHVMDTKTATNSLTMSGYDVDYTLANIVKTELIGKILDTRYLEAVREKEGGTYGVDVWCNLVKYNEPHIDMQISFDTDPDKQNHLLDIIYDEIEKIIKEGPLESDLAKAKEIMIKDYERESRYNFTMMSHLQDYYKNGFNYGKDYVNTVNSITGEDIRLMLKKLYEQKNIIEAVLMPARN